MSPQQASARVRAVRDLLAVALELAASVRDVGPRGTRSEASQLACGLADADELARDLELQLRDQAA